MDKEGLLYRIISGIYYINVADITYKVISPNLLTKQKAHQVYLDILNSNKFDMKCWLKKAQADKILEVNGVWNSDKEKELKKLEDRLEELKVDLYKKFQYVKRRTRIKKSISNLLDDIRSMKEQKHSMDHLTLEYYAETVKNENIICSTIFLEDKLAFDLDKTDTNLLTGILEEIKSKKVDIDDIRSLARHEIWQNYWGPAKENVFPLPVCNWTDEQRSLVSLSRMYDSVRESPECPSDDIIQDDDALDGWFIFQRKEREKEKKRNKVMDSVGDKYKDAGEIFLVTDSVEEARDIYELNDAQGAAQVNHIKQIGKDADASVPWQDLPHVKMELQQQINERQKQFAKK